MPENVTAHSHRLLAETANPEIPIQTMVVFPDGSVCWDAPENAIAPEPYGRSPLKDRRLAMAYRSTVGPSVPSEVGLNARWVLAGAAIALLAVAFGALLPHWVAASSQDQPAPPTCPNPLEIQRYSATPNLSHSKDL